MTNAPQGKPPEPPIGQTGLVRLLRPADKLLTRIIAVLQMLFTLWWLVMTPFVFNYGGAAANPTGFQLWLLFWFTGLICGACLLSAQLWARVLALCWNTSALWQLLDRIHDSAHPANGSLALSWFTGITVYLVVTSSVPLVRQLESPELRTRLLIRVAFVLTAVLAAIIVYAWLHTEKALIMKLDSTSESTRCSAAEELAKTGPAAQKALPKLQAMLANTACVQFGQDKFPDYVEAIGGIDPFIRAMRTEQGADSPKLAWWLRYHAHLYPQRASDIVPLLIQGLHSQDPLVRHASAEGLGTLGPAASDAVPELENALNDSDADVRSSAVASLGDLRSLDGLKMALTISDPQVRRIAIERLGGMSPDEIGGAQQGYKEMLNDPELSELGRKSIQRLYPPPNANALRGHGVAALPSLIDALNDPEPNNATAAAHRLSVLGRQALPALEPLQNTVLHAASRDTRLEALHALREIGPEGLPAISEALDDAEQEVRDYAIKLLASYDRGVGVPALVTFLKRDWNSSSITALNALESLHRDALPALPQLEHWAMNVPDPEGRRAAINALALVGPEAFPAVEKATHDDDLAVSTAAQSALKGMRARYGLR